MPIVISVFFIICHHPDLYVCAHGCRNASDNNLTAINGAAREMLRHLGVVQPAAEQQR